jgi:galactosamine-6-phosphate isomerase
MKVDIFDNYELLSEHAADIMVEQIKNKANSVIAMASGETTRLTYELFTKKVLKQKVDYSNVTFVAFDEWVNIPPTTEGSCYHFFQQYLARPLSLPSNKFYFFDGMAKDLNKEVDRMDAVVTSIGGFDLMIVGIGVNGHIGFNEPGTPFDSHSHVRELEEQTKIVSQKYFKESTPVGKGITLGLGHVMEARKVILLANGKKKTSIIAKTLKSEISPKIPATILRNHTNSFMMLDVEAAAEIEMKKIS